MEGKKNTQHTEGKTTRSVKQKPCTGRERSPIRVSDQLWFVVFVKDTSTREKGVMKLWCAQPRRVGRAMGSSGWLQARVILAAAYAGAGWEQAILATEGWKLVGGGVGAGGRGKGWGTVPLRCTQV